ncbi:MAG: hypothetical protein QXT39_06655 [Conexivisphaerales archaeon]
MEENRRKIDNSQMLLTSSFSEVSPILKSIYGLLESQKATMLFTMVKALLEKNDRKTFR